MWTFLYNASLFLYGLAIRISSLFNHKAAQWINGRQFIFESLRQRVWNETIWFHCASVGEFEQGYPLIKQLQKRYPSSTLLVTFFSPSGYEFAKKRYTDFHIFYLRLRSQHFSTLHLASPIRRPDVDALVAKIKELGLV